MFIRFSFLLSFFLFCSSLLCFFLALFLAVFLSSSTILEEEKLQQKERNRMEMRRQVTVSWDSGGSDEAPPKVRWQYTAVCGMVPKFSWLKHSDFVCCI